MLRQRLSSHNLCGFPFAEKPALTAAVQNISAFGRNEAHRAGKSSCPVHFFVLSRGASSIQGLPVAWSAYKKWTFRKKFFHLIKPMLRLPALYVGSGAPAAGRQCQSTPLRGRRVYLRFRQNLCKIRKKNLLFHAIRPLFQFLRFCLWMDAEAHPLPQAMTKQIER